MRECSPPQTCHVSRVTCHMSHVTCHMSHVTCHIFLFIFFLGQSGEAYWSRVCYQRGLPRLVFLCFLESCQQLIVYTCNQSSFRVQRTFDHSASLPWRSTLSCWHHQDPKKLKKTFTKS